MKSSGKTANAEKEPETHGQILDAAIHHFAEYGYQGASMSKIAEEAKVSKSLIFWYFETKESLFQSLIDRFLKSCIETLANAGPDGDAKTKIESLIDVYWSFIRKNYPFVRIFMNWFMQLKPRKKEKASIVRKIHREFQQIFSNYLQEGIDSGIFREDLDVPSTTLFLVSTLEGILLQLFIKEMDFDSLGSDFFQTTKRNLMEGLVAK